MTLTAAPGCRPSLLIVGCGDIGQRVLRLLHPRWRVFALTSSAGQMAPLRRLGATPVLGNLDQRATLTRLGALADAVLHLAPPPTTASASAAGDGDGDNDNDPRTRALLRVLARAGRVQRLVYASTSGVYGDCGGALFDETRAVAPATARAWRRVDAERQVRSFGRRAGVCVTVLRIPGIYASTRPGGHPRERLQRGTAVLAAPDDVFTNHIHADDLARACVAALLRGAPQRVVHVSDDTRLKMGDYFDLAADLCGLPQPPRITRVQAAQQLGPMQLSFMSESRQLNNHRLKRELRLVLRYPTVLEGLQRG